MMDPGIPMERKQVFRATFVLSGLFILTLACNLPILNNARLVNNTTHLPTQGTAVQDTPNTQPVEGRVVSSPDLPTVVTSAMGSATTALPISSPLVTSTIQPPVSHTITPGQPPAFKSEIDDVVTKPYAESKYSPGGDSYKVIILERPFDAGMKYRPDIDIIKAELAVDPDFYYVSIYLAGQVMAGKHPFYGVEIDNDYDGRGDYLIWCAAPTETLWRSELVEVYQDTNNDVGRTRPLFSDVPSAGDGYDQKMAFVAEDPDMAFCRLSPNLSPVVQLAFKPQLLGQPHSFMWGVYADDGLKSPAMFDYNDLFGDVEAGSPLQKSPNYPLKKLYNVDNTCRMSYGRLYSATDPGACGIREPTAVPSAIPTLLPTFLLPPLITIQIPPPLFP